MQSGNGGYAITGNGTWRWPRNLLRRTFDADIPHAKRALGLLRPMTS